MSNEHMSPMEAPRYNGVPVTHPTLVKGILNLIHHKEKTYTTDEIARIIGVPHEVVRKYQRIEEMKKGQQPMK